jgi:glutaredoxin
VGLGVAATAALAILLVAVRRAPPPPQTPSSAPAELTREPASPLPAEKSSTPAGDVEKPPAASRWVSARQDDAPEASARPVATERAAKDEASQRQQVEFEAWAHREATQEMAEDDARSRRMRGDPRPANGLPASERSVAPRDERSLAELAQGVRITMYSTSWCGVCARARAFLQGSQIPFTDRDVEADAMAAQEARRLNPRGSVPTFDIAGTALVGFSPRSLTAAIVNAAGNR